MQDENNKPKQTAVVRGKRFIGRLSLEDDGVGHSSATKDTRLLHKEG